MTYQATEIMLLFFIYAFLGWCCEVAFAACKSGKFVNRGFLNGPVCPIYGFGVLGVVFALAPVKNNVILLYLGSVVITSLIEFVTGFLLEKIFHARWWDYSDMPLNIMGYVCLLFSMIWGLACMIIVYWIHPLIARGVRLLPRLICMVLDGVFIALFILDICATVAAVRRISERLKKLTELGMEMHGISDEIGMKISEKTLDAKQRLQTSGESFYARREQLQKRIEQGEAKLNEWFDQQREQTDERTENLRRRFESIRESGRRIMNEKDFSQKRLLNAFPNLRSNRHHEALEMLKDFYKKHHKNQK